MTKKSLNHELLMLTVTNLEMVKKVMTKKGMPRSTISKVDDALVAITRMMQSEGNK